MGKIKVTIEKGAELFGAWADVPGIYGEGETVQETKESIMSAIELYKKYNDVLPEQLQGDVEVEWTFDVQSFLHYYNGIFSKSALEKITGVNQKLLGHYASGLKKPRKGQVEKIETSLHKFINDLSLIHLV
jgi:predicted RNase H-like HicB family nuclease